MPVPAAGAHPLNQPIHLVRLATRLSNFGHDDVRVESTVDPGRELEVAMLVRHSLHADEHVLFRVIEPVAGATGTNDALQLLYDHKSVECGVDG